MRLSGCGYPISTPHYYNSTPTTPFPPLQPHHQPITPHHTHAVEGLPSLREALKLHISCGQFSYANISPACTLGVSGTVEAMGAYDGLAMNQYGIEVYTHMPSVYGKNIFPIRKWGHKHVVVGSTKGCVWVHPDAAMSTLGLLKQLKQCVEKGLLTAARSGQYDSDSGRKLSQWLGDAVLTQLFWCGWFHGQELYRPLRSRWPIICDRAWSCCLDF